MPASRTARDRRWQQSLAPESHSFLRWGPRTDTIGAFTLSPSLTGYSPAVSRNLPQVLLDLTQATCDTSRDSAWEQFVQHYTRLLIHTCRAAAAGYDDAMERYTYVLEQLRLNDYRRLRAFDLEGSGKFSTWLVAVTTRLCTDFHRQRYGRDRSSQQTTDRDATRSKVRRRLADLLAVDIDLDRLEDTSGPDPESDLRARELHAALEQAIAGLDGRDHFLLTLRFNDGLRAREIADVMRFPTQFHVYRRLRRVLKLLRDSLEDLGVHDAEP